MSHRPTTCESASSALYHIAAIERRLAMLKLMINPLTGTVTDTQVMSRLALAVDDEIVELRDDLVRLM